MAETAECTHLDQAHDVTPNTESCEECMATGDKVIARRMCLACGHVGCCDSSTGKHARAHFESTGHPVMKSIEPGRDWRWCYLDNAYV